MRVNGTILGDAKKPTDITRWNERLALAVNGNLNHGSTMSNSDADNNMNNWKFQGTSPGAANTDFTLAHNLGRIPITIDCQDTDNGGLIYRSPVTPWSKTSVTFRCTTASAHYNVIVI